MKVITIRGLVLGGSAGAGRNDDTDAWIRGRILHVGRWELRSSSWLWNRFMAFTVFPFTGVWRGLSRARPGYGRGLVLDPPGEKSE